MYLISVYLHNLLRWVILVLAVIAIFKAYSGMTNRKPFGKSDTQIGLFLMISAHITFLIGLYQWSFGPVGLQNILNSGMGIVMKDKVSRYWAIEHFTAMLIAIVLITIGRGVSKKSLSDKTKHKKTFWYYLIAVLIILATAPWPFRTGIGRPLLPGMHM